MRYIIALALLPLCAFAKADPDKFVADLLEDELFAEEAMQSPIDKDMFADIELRKEIVSDEFDSEIAAEDNSGIEVEPVYQARPQNKAKASRKASECRGGRPRAFANK